MQLSWHSAIAGLSTWSDLQATYIVALWPLHMHHCMNTPRPIKYSQKANQLGEKGRPSLFTHTMCKSVFTMAHFIHRSKTFRRKYRGKIFSESRHNFLHGALENGNWAWSKSKTQHCSENITTTKTTHYKKVLSIFIINKGTVSKNIRNSQNSVKT